MNQSSVSVALCTFNGAAFVTQQVRSILEQSLLPDEIVVSDDGSTDATIELIRTAFSEYAGSPVELRVLPPGSHLGVTANFERAIAATRGDLVVLCDQDDVWHHDRLSVAVPHFAEDPDLLFQHSNATLVGNDGAPLGVSLFEALSVSRQERELIATGHAFNAYIRRNLATGAASMLRRSLWEVAAPFPREWVHDEWLAIIGAAVGGVGLLDREVIDYRQHGGNQIGVAKPTLRYRLGRMMEPRGDRYAVLAARSGRLADRLRGLGVAPEFEDLAVDKSRFETVRSQLPQHRLPRIPVVISEFRRGSYARLSSQGNADVLRDLLQPR